MYDLIYQPRKNITCKVHLIERKNNTKSIHSAYIMEFSAMLLCLLKTNILIKPHIVASGLLYIVWVL